MSETENFNDWMKKQENLTVEQKLDAATRTAESFWQCILYKDQELDRKNEIIQGLKKRLRWRE